MYNGTILLISDPNFFSYSGESRKIRLSCKSSFVTVNSTEGETNILYLTTCKVRYFRPLFVIILIIMAYSLWKPQIKKFKNLEYFMKSIKNSIIKIITNKSLKYLNLHVMSLCNILVSSFKLNYWNKWTFTPYSNFSTCTCISAIYQWLKCNTIQA